MLLVLVLSVFLRLAVASDADLQLILDGVNEIYCNGCVPGVMVVFGNNSFPILSGTDNGQMFPIAAASRYGAGRVITASHDSLLSVRPGLVDSDRFLINSINWACNWTSSDVTGRKAAVLQGYSGATNLNNFLNNYTQYDSQILPFSSLSNLAVLKQFNVLIMQNMWQYTLEDNLIDIIKQYVSEGGSLVTAMTSWIADVNWDFYGNRLTRDAGMIWLSQYAFATSPNGNLNTSTALLVDTHSDLVIQNVLTILTNPEVEFPGSHNQQGGIIKNTIQHLPHDRIGELAALKNAISNLTAIIPSKENPVAWTPYNKFQVDTEFSMWAYVFDPQEVTAHPSSAIFPGAVNSTERVQTVAEISIPYRQFRTGLKIHGEDGPWGKFEKPEPNLQAVEGYSSHWYSTGSYAPPGTLVTVGLSAASNISAFTVRIGCHRDDLSDKTEWVRYPMIVMVKRISGASTTISSPFGGLIYISNVVSDEAIQILNVTVTGGVVSPSFFKGTTSVQEWRDTIRYFGAPWSEFVGERVVLSVPADVARTVEDPFELLVFWDDVINSISDFAGVVRSENYQRFVFDADIGGGYMHSGFPIMALLGSAGNSVNLTILRQNVGDNRGFFHELGHNHQWHEWTFEGGTEVTCNIFSMYVMNQFLGHPMPDTRPHILLPENLRRYITQYISEGINYPNFQRDYDRGLIFYYQLERIFGWAAYKEVFQRYRDLPGVNYQGTMMRSVTPGSLFFQLWCNAIFPN
ncbi:TRPM8 channel-associated factor 3-like [Folsomia candida]|uniref:TRPM8 channel-associated factor 3-like n=1 Tax=Folsomia candida TaxID=158441 RepID=UPI0016052267|nr:TRPM8 channel-associated factor 3-like [Folsomia candida]